MPLDVMDGEALLMTNVGEIEYHRHTDELVVPLVYGGTAPSDDDFGEMVVKGHAGVAESHRRVAIDDERGQS